MAEDEPGELARAREEIAQLRAEREALRRAVVVAAAARGIAAPSEEDPLLALIVETAARVIAAQAASLFLVDAEAEELVFAVALGPKGAEARGIRVPLGHGVAGLVAVTGQPIALADAQRDARHAADIAERIGYQPRSILCVPLAVDGEVIGVLELLDKEGATSFSPSDMATLGLFARQAAAALARSRLHDDLAALIRDALGLPPAGPGAEQAALLAREVAAGADYRRALDLAPLVQEVAGAGEAEAALCRAILADLTAYLRARADPLGGQEPGR